MSEKYNIPSTPDYFDFLNTAKNIDELFKWFNGATITGIYNFKISEDVEPILLTDSINVNFIAPNLAAKHMNNNRPVYKFLRTRDNKFLCQKEE